MNIPRTTRGWIRHFEWNAAHLLKVDWHLPAPLSQEEFTTIADSLRIFQLGESSDGASLRMAARGFALTRGDQHLEEAVSRFIDEETRHADWLGRFMDQQELPRSYSHWSDHVFRRLRRLGNLEICLTVLLTAELVAKVYYHALYRATSCTRLRQICRQLLRDEVFHVYFHTQLLRKMHSQNPALRNAIWKSCYRFFHRGTLLVVWLGHRRVFHMGGFPFRKYWKTSEHYCKKALSLLSDPEKTIPDKFKGEAYVEPNAQQLFH